MKLREDQHLQKLRFWMNDFYSTKNIQSIVFIQDSDTPIMWNFPDVIGAPRYDKKKKNSLAARVKPAFFVGSC